MPNLPPRMLDCTFYLYPSMEDAKKGKRYGGTGFIVGVASEAFPGKLVYLYGLTNWHVAVRDGSSCVRLHRVDGSHQIFAAGPEDWEFIGGAQDVAAVPLPLKSGEHRFSYFDTSLFATKELIEKGKIGLGDAAFMLGRFIDHDGGERNAPAARFGHISLMPADAIRQPTGAMQESFCLDMHSRTGFSGSPAFMYRTPGSDFNNPNIELADRYFYLLGIHWGQFAEPWELTSDAKLTAKAAKESLVIDGGYVKGLSGMTCVIPAWRIMDVLNLPKFKAQRTAGDKNHAKKLTDEPPEPAAESTSSGK